MGNKCLVHILNHNWAAILADFFHILSHNWAILVDLVHTLYLVDLVLRSLIHSYNCYSAVMVSLKALSVSLHLAAVADKPVAFLMDTFDSLVAAALEFTFIMQAAKP